MAKSTPHTSRYWADWSTRDFEQLRQCGEVQEWIAVLPLAATEQHGPHLPLKVDSALVDGVVAACLPHVQNNAKVLFLPTLTVGFSPEHSAFAGTLTLKAETVIRLWTDIAESVAASGFKKLVLLNAHGGQVGFMDIVGRDLRARLGMLVYSVNWFNLPLQDAQGNNLNDLFSAHEHRFGVHAGEIETSMMLVLDPCNVQMQHAQKFASTSEQRARQYAILGDGKTAKLAWQMQDYNPSGAVGDAANASPDKGRQVILAAGLALAKLLAELQDLPLDILRQNPMPGEGARKQPTA